MLYLAEIAGKKIPVASGEKAEEFDIPTVKNSVSLKIYLVQDQNCSQLYKLYALCIIPNTFFKK